MKTASIRTIVLGLVAGACCSSVAWAQVYHPAQLNWDFLNWTGGPANDFEIIIADPTYNPDVNDPNQVYTGSLGFPRAVRTVGDFDPGNPGNEVKIRWSGRVIGSNEIAHIGLDTFGAQDILSAQWSFDGGGLSWRAPITFEKTRVTPRQSFFDINMELNFPQSFFDDPDGPFPMAGWTGIRTFMDIPEALLSLVDLNVNLDLDADWLSVYETAPRWGGFDGDLIDQTGVFMAGDNSIFDVWVGQSNLANPGFESLLFAEVLVGSGSDQEWIGQFWNLNVQSPAPGTLALLGLGGLFAARRRR